MIEYNKYNITLKDGFRGAKNRQAKKKRRTDGAWYYLGLVGQIGYVIALPIAGGAIFGSYIDKQYGWYPKGTISGIVTGLAVSAVGFVRIIRQICHISH